MNQYNFSNEKSNLILDSNPPNPVVVEEECLDPREERDIVHLSDLIVGEVDGVELIQGRTQVLN